MVFFRLKRMADSIIVMLGECRVAGIEPWKGDCVVFVSRCRTRIKVLFADETGLWMSYKQFAKGAIATQIAMLTSPNVTPPFRHIAS